MAKKKSKKQLQATRRRSRKIVFERPWLYPEQEEFLYTPARYSVVEAATKTGKTYGCIVWLIEQACVNGGLNRHFWWVAPNYSQAGIAFGRVCEYLPDGYAKPNKTAMTVTLINGSVIAFKTGEKPDALYGEDVYAAVIDEATRMREAAWVAIRSTLTATRGPVRIIGNVKGRKNWAYKLARRAEAGAPNTYFARLDAYTASKYGIYPAGEIEEARQTLPPEAFQELYLAIPTEDGANPFGHNNIAICGRPRLADGPPIAFGVDVARQEDWTVVIGLNKDLDVCYFDRFQRIPWPDIEKRVMEAVKHKPCLVDSTGAGDPFLAHVQKRCELAQGFVFSKRSKQDLMEHLAFGVQQHRLGFPMYKEKDSIGKNDSNDPRILCKEMQEFEYSYGPTGVTYSAPEGLHDDCVCALALAYMMATRSNYNAVKPYTEQVYAPYSI